MQYDIFFVISENVIHKKKLEKLLSSMSLTHRSIIFMKTLISSPHSVVNHVIT